MLIAVGIVVAGALAVLLVLVRREARNAQALSATREEARKQTAAMDAIVAGMPDGILVVDADLRVVKWNEHFPDFAGVPTKLLHEGQGLAEVLRAQAVGGEFGDVDVDAEVERRLALIRSGASTGAIVRRRPNGRVLELRRSPMADSGFVTLYTDITARCEAEQQLRQAQKMEAVGQLTGGMAHDFNNLLTVIGSNQDLALEALGKSDLVGADRRVRTAQAGTQRAATLTKRLLAFARKQDLLPEIADANRIVSDMSELIRHSIGTAVELETVLAGGLWDALIDTHQLENALINLAINSHDAMPGGGKLTIETANTHLDATYAAHNTEVTPGQYVMVAVSDSGTGMTPEQVEKAFEPFYSTKGPGKGSGLGLSQVFGFIKQSNGHVKIYSELGAGTTIRMYLPRYVEDEPEISLLQVSAPRLDLPRARDEDDILVVEDDEDVLVCSVEALESLGYQVLGVRNAMAALSALESHPQVRLLFTDVELPDRNGQDLAVEVLQRRPDIAVLYATGYAANAVLHRHVLVRGARALTKPFTLSELAKAVREVLDTKALENALRQD